MKESFVIFAILTLFSLSLYATDKLVMFALEDQFEKTHNEKEFLGKKFLMIGGTTDSMELHKEFTKALREAMSSALLEETKI